jgi:hypothetical protein
MAIEKIKLYSKEIIMEKWIELFNNINKKKNV